MRFDPIAIIGVYYMDLFLIDHPHGIHQVFVEGQATDIIPNGFGNDDAMYF
jgi:hypothetical protein